MVPPHEMQVLRPVPPHEKQLILPVPMVLRSPRPENVRRSGVEGLRESPSELLPLHDVQAVVPPHDAQVLKPLPPQKTQVITDASYASGHEKIRVCGQLAPGSRPSFLQSCGHRGSRLLAMCSLPAHGVS